VTKPRTLVVALCTALVLTMTGFMPVAAVLPEIFADWRITEAEAGWLNGVFFGGYAAGVPLLLPLTDRMDSRRVMLFAFALSAIGGFGFAFFADGLWSGMAFRVLAGIGLAGIHFPGLKLIADRLEGTARDRGSAVYISMFSIGGAVSFIGAGVIVEFLHWKAVFTVSGICAVLALLLTAIVVPARSVIAPKDIGLLPDFRPVFRNGPAMRYVIAYFGHVWEVFAMRGWSVALLTFSAAQIGNEVFTGWNMAILSGAVSMLMMPTSVGVAELASRFGRVRTVCFASAVTVLLVVLLVLFKTGPFLLIVVFIGAYLMAGFGDTATLANGIVGAAEDRYRGITLAAYALSGFLGGMVGPVVFGIVLDFAGGRDSGTAWSWAFGSLLLGTLVVVLPLTLRRRKTA